VLTGAGRGPPGDDVQRLDGRVDRMVEMAMFLRPLPTEKVPCVTAENDALLRTKWTAGQVSENSPNWTSLQRDVW
jgi:hypothetical protein